jgi:AcrR family transcriptional regulator
VDQTGGRAPRRTREATERRREDILQAATAVFGARGYSQGSLAEIAERVGMTHAGVLHHFGSKEQLLLAVLDRRDRSDLAQVADQRLPEGLELFRHLARTAARNVERPGLVAAFTVLSADSVTDGHPAQAHFRERYAHLRGLVAVALREACDPAGPPDEADLDAAAAGILAVMDGLQVQWLLDPARVDLAGSTAFAIEALLSAAVAGRPRPRPLTA